MKTLHCIINAFYKLYKHFINCLWACDLMLCLIIIIIINEYSEAGQRPLFLFEVDNIYTNINQN